MYVNIFYFLQAIFMICEPPKTQEKLKAVIEKYVIDLTFYKPSSKFPIGWQARPGYDFIGNEICDNIIFMITIRSDQNSRYSYALDAGEWYDDI